MSDTDKEIREECDELLIKLDIPGYPDDLLEVEEFAKAQRRQGAVDALRAAAGQVKDMGLGFGGVFDGGRTITLRALIAWLEKKADRIEGEDDDD